MEQEKDSKRDKFLAKVFGTFSEKIVEIWCECEKSKYRNLGRPTISCSNRRNVTLDFTFKSRLDEKIFIAEQKCWLEYEDYKYLTLDSAAQLERVGKSNESFDRFLKTAKKTAENPGKYSVTVTCRVTAKITYFCNSKTT